MNWFLIWRMLFSFSMGVLVTLAIMFKIASRQLKKEAVLLAAQQAEADELKAFNDELINKLLKNNEQIQDQQEMLISTLVYYDNLTPSDIVDANKLHNTQIYDHWLALEEKRVHVLESLLAIDPNLLVRVQNGTTKIVENIPLQGYLDKVKKTIARYRQNDATASDSHHPAPATSNKTYLC